MLRKHNLGLLDAGQHKSLFAIVTSDIHLDLCAMTRSKPFKYASFASITVRNVYMPQFRERHTR
jgi:hypothetical protein